MLPHTLLRDKRGPFARNMLSWQTLVFSIVTLFFRENGILLYKSKFVHCKNHVLIFDVLGYVCDLPKEEGSCTQATPRFYYDSVSESCLQFLYTGCHGNLNNFLSLNDCQKFCAGTSMDPIRALVNDDGTLMMDLYDVGFAMVGPLARAEKHDADFNR